MQVQRFKKNHHLSSYYLLDDFQWKRENRNLQKFIQNQHLTSYNLFKSRHFQTKKSIKNRKLSLMRSLQNINLKEKAVNKRPFSPEIIILKSTQNFTEKQHKTPKSKKSQELFCSKISNILNQKQDFGTQTSQQNMGQKRRNSVQQSNCMKDLIKILEKQILSFTKIISQDKEQINILKLEISGLKQKLTEQKQINQLLNEKLKKETELNLCMEYIIAELNQKVKALMDKISQLQQLIQENSQNFQQKTIEGFIDSQSSLQMNSLMNINSNLKQVIKQNDSICQQTASNIFPQDYQNWSCSILQMSSFNKTPNKVHQVPQNQNHQLFSPINQKLNQDSVIDQIIRKHQFQINKLNEKIKYFEIQNLMLKRKKQISEKNNQEVNELKTKIQKLSQQNKIIKLIQNKNTKKLQTSELKIKKAAKSKNTQSNQQSTPSSEQKVQKMDTKKEKSQIYIQDTENIPNNIFESKEKQRTKSLKNEKQHPKRKNPLQRKFVRKQKSPRSSRLKSDDDSEISLSLSPERV